MKVLSFILLTILLISCGSIKPEQPNITENKIQYEQKPSTIHIPIEVNLKPFLQDAEKQTPKKFADEKQQCEGISFAYQL